MDFSVGILAYNEEANIATLIRNLLNQPLEPDLNLAEIVVIASGCSDRTQEIVKDFSTSSILLCKIVGDASIQSLR